MLEIRKLHKAFGRVVTANGIDLKIEKGVHTSIIGPNGAGKSTLIN
ncbi:MAG: ATP-binding cassette domain-containing protein, partial [Deltaproteobacteria bacterium]|nr:ATP-binding cassette domain-containing protein [Deltaproteobacteria bacterium]